MKTDVEQLVEILTKASEAYYTGASIMSDIEYDVLRDRLSKLDPSNPVLAAVGAKSNSVWPKVKHARAMGSLLKETDLADLHAWAEKYTTGTVHWSEKLDGFALSLTYVDGRFVRAVTRGDGEVGDDISANVLKMKNLPLHIDFMPVCHVRAEALIDLKTWADHFDGDANPRNSAAGTARRLSGEKCEHIMLIVHGVEYEDQKINAHFATESARFAELSRLGFTLPASGSCHHTSLDPVLSNYEDNIRSSLGYEIDGIVVKSDDVIHAQELGDVDGRPRAARAWKFKSLGAMTKIIGITWQTGRVGVISPVAELQPINIGGVTISRSLLDNYPMMQKLGLFPNKDVFVERANDIIPRLNLLPGEVYDSTSFAMPETCPSCGARTEFDSVRLFCTNDTDCPAQLNRTIMKYLRVLGVKGIGEKLIEKLMDEGLVTTPADLYRLGVSSISALEGQGSKNAKKVVDELRNKSKAVPLDKFVESLAMYGFGSKAKDLLVYYPTLPAMRAAKYDDILKIDGFGEYVAKCVVDGFATKSELIDKLLEYVTIVEPKAAVSDKLSGMSFCFTGFRDKEAEDKIVSLGGKIASGVSKNTTHLVVADLKSSSTKANKAKELGIQILDPTSMAKMLQ